VKVLYATDGFDPSIHARELLERIAHRERVHVHVVSVTHAGIPAPEHLAVVLDRLEDRRKDTRVLVDTIVERVRTAGFSASGQTLEGHPGEEIVRAAESERADLIVVGAGRRSWLGSRLLGSVSTHVLHSSQTSVLIVHELAVDERRARILFATDGSDGADAAMDLMSRLVDPSRVQVDVVSVAPEVSPVVAMLPGGTYVESSVYSYDEVIRRQARDLAQRSAQDAAQTLRDAGFGVEALVVAGNPAEQLLKEADNREVDLVVLGSRGLGAVGRALLGSVSDHVMRHAKATLVGRR
jgi:nucleotide-binding universal stress UspA family protein